ncbi:hypothetical protein AY599_07965 [Leptolyngbya valderiana BDU 20041]|nr:hypothetical protein AY599_07965 [Leptolyngbya valderiana BDU 20041]
MRVDANVARGRTAGSARASPYENIVNDFKFARTELIGGKSNFDRVATKKRLKKIDFSPHDGNGHIRTAKKRTQIDSGFSDRRFVSFVTD